LGAQHALVVYGQDGLDELSLGASTLVGELKDGQVTEYELHPEDFGLAMAATRRLRVADATESAAMLRGVLAGDAGTARDIVLLNAGAALYAANLVSGVPEGIERAREVIDSGAARAKLDAFVAATHG
jgi:anthranilate phosphoribosyltransferase